MVTSLFEIKKCCFRFLSSCHQGSPDFPLSIKGVLISSDVILYPGFLGFGSCRIWGNS